MKSIKKPVTVDKLRPLFTYDHKGVPVLENYGAFSRGITLEEIDIYLMVRTNTRNIAHFRRKLFNKMGCATCRCEIVNGQEVVLYYRHDISRYADYIFENIPTYFD